MIKTPISASRLIFLSTYPPQQCGIATFTHDLVTALGARIGESRVKVAAVAEHPLSHEFPKEVIAVCDRNNREAYRNLAEQINHSGYDAVSVQHEFGIFGGDEGAYLLDLMRAVRKPVITTLHTVLSDPSEAYHRRLRQVVDASDAVVVLTPGAIRILTNVYGAPARKLVMIPHGIPDASFTEPDLHTARIGAARRLVIRTYGLLGPSKGIEEMIQAMPAIVDRHPEALYMIVGATHPGILASHGEGYRRSLESLVAGLRMTEHVVFRDGYLTDAQLDAYLSACTICVTPYPNREQISSGTLARALGAGVAIVSTPYWYAQDLLADGRGMLADFHSPRSLARAVNEIIEHPQERVVMRRKAYEFGRGMRWNQVAGDYLRVVAELSATRSVKVPMVLARGNDAGSKTQHPSWNNIVR